MYTKYGVYYDYLPLFRIPNKGNGTGFVGHFKNNHKDLYLLITDHHVFTSKDYAYNALVTFGHQNDEQKPPAITGDKLFNFNTTGPSLWFTDNETNSQDEVCYYLVLMYCVYLVKSHGAY